MKSKSEKINCYHCGDKCLSDTIKSKDKFFCCLGCRTVFEILEENELCNYYSLEQMPGINMKSQKQARFDYLSQEEVIEKLIDFRDESIFKVQFYLPQIHCSACLWLLENLYKLNPTILESRVNFLKKEIRITFEHSTLSLKELVELLTSLGYEPKITLDQLDQETKKTTNKRLSYQIGLAGFAFGNIMLMSLPEYFGLDVDSFRNFSHWFSWINLGLATPVAFFSGQDYFKSAFKSIQLKRLNIDVPIAIGILVLFVRSSYEVISSTGTGYFDSLCGLLFFLLLGRIFQEKIYHQLSFERDYRSYFPISITLLKENLETNIPINQIKKGDKILIRNGELIPVDAYLIEGLARIDNSFATGESIPIHKNIGDKIYAGGRQIGEAIRLEVIRPLNQSKLTQLWSSYANKEASTATFSKMTDQISEWFTPIILLLAIVAGIIHINSGIGKSIEVVSAVLIVACPCALALAAPFTFGHAMRWLGKQNCYLREASVLEEMAKINHIVFDKTGTLTISKQENTSYIGEPLTQEMQQALFSLVNQSTHPLSQLIKKSLGSNISFLKVQNFKEHNGKGIKGIIDNINYRLGSTQWIQNKSSQDTKTEVVFEKNGTVLGVFNFKNEYRKNLKQLISSLSKKFVLTVISGDNQAQKVVLQEYFPDNSLLLFNQSPEDKLKIIRSLKNQNKQVMMVGDGLNDAGALREAQVGVSVTEDVNAFSPACDIIISGRKFEHLQQFLKLAKSSKNIVILSFIISFLYNIVGLSYAMQGLLSPVFAAILMPISSITVVAFVSIAVNLRGWQLSKK
ncbi:MAG: heavy metal translocating P-type ATPase metal-binding domain-containing protein [Flavobacteriales bacterium]|nr:heavy metal translocating P-type ATPase metal-binding domain-containing protein [Flavobacteriales bacterium]